jgi:hypothetical protein
LILQARYRGLASGDLYRVTALLNDLLLPKNAFLYRFCLHGCSPLVVEVSTVTEFFAVAGVSRPLVD